MEKRPLILQNRFLQKGKTTHFFWGVLPYFPPKSVKIGENGRKIVKDRRTILKDRWTFLKDRWRFLKDRRTIFKYKNVKSGKGKTTQNTHHFYRSRFLGFFSIFHIVHQYIPHSKLQNLPSWFTSILYILYLIFKPGCRVICSLFPDGFINKHVVPFGEYYHFLWFFF